MMNLSKQIETTTASRLYSGEPNGELVRVRNRKKARAMSYQTRERKTLFVSHFHTWRHFVVVTLECDKCKTQHYTPFSLRVAYELTVLVHFLSGEYLWGAAHCQVYANNQNLRLRSSQPQWHCVCSVLIFRAARVRNSHEEDDSSSAGCFQYFIIRVYEESELKFSDFLGFPIEIPAINSKQMNLILMQMSQQLDRSRQRIFHVACQTTKHVVKVSRYVFFYFNLSGNLVLDMRLIMTA